MGRDYHGSRTYDADEPRIGRTNLAFAWALSSAKRRLRNLLLWAAPPSSSRTLLQNGKRSFSELGARSPKPTPVRADDCPFPKRAPRPNNDWRVLP
jgi:hypothetical protein